MERKKIILNPTEYTHKAVKVAAAKTAKSINELCLNAIEKDPTVKEALHDLRS
jgi:hypothetical protein